MRPGTQDSASPRTLLSVLSGQPLQIETCAIRGKSLTDAVLLLLIEGTRGVSTPLALAIEVVQDLHLEIVVTWLCLKDLILSLTEKMISQL